MGVAATCTEVYASRDSVPRLRERVFPVRLGSVPLVRFSLCICRRVRACVRLPLLTSFRPFAVVLCPLSPSTYPPTLRPISLIGDLIWFSCLPVRGGPVFSCV